LVESLLGRYFSLGKPTPQSATLRHDRFHYGTLRPFRCYTAVLELRPHTVSRLRTPGLDAPHGLNLALAASRIQRSADNVAHHLNSIITRVPNSASGSRPGAGSCYTDRHVCDMVRQFAIQTRDTPVVVEPHCAVLRQPAYLIPKFPQWLARLLCCSFRLSTGVVAQPQTILHRPRAEITMAISAHAHAKVSRRGDLDE
jgi:hypothetical protein